MGHAAVCKTVIVLTRQSKLYIFYCNFSAIHLDLICALKACLNYGSITFILDLLVYFLKMARAFRYMLLFWFLSGGEEILS